MPAILFLRCYFLVVSTFWLSVSGGVQPVKSDIDISMKPGAPFVHNYTPEDFGAGPMNWAAAQGKNGLMYFANEKGVLEYDGVGWRLIETVAKGLVRSLAVDDRGLIYVGGRGEFGYLESVDNTGMTYHSLSHLLPEKDKKFQDVWSTHVTSHGVYFVTLEKIFHYYNGKLYALACNRENIGFSIMDDVVVFHMQGGLSRLQNGRLWSLPQTEVFSRDTTGRIAIVQYSAEKLLIATEKMGGFMYHLDLVDEPESKAPFLEAFPTQADDYFRENFLYYFATRTQDGRFVFPTIQGGAVFLDKSGKLIQIVNEKHGLNSTGIAQVFSDKDHNIWAVSTSGISHLEVSSPWSRFEMEQGKVSPILTIEKHKGTLYLGTLKGVFYLPRQTGAVSEHSHHILPLQEIRNQCYALFPHGELVLAGADNEVFGIHAGSVSKLMSFKKHRWIYSMGKSRKFQDTFFVGLYSAGLTAVEIRAKCDQSKIPAGSCKKDGYEAKVLAFQANEIADESITMIREDDQGNLWLLSIHGGLIHLMLDEHDLNNFRIVRYGLDDGLPTLQNNRIDWINNQLVVTNHQGIYRAVERSIGVDEGGKRYSFVPDRLWMNNLPQNTKEIYGVYAYGIDLIVDGPDYMGVLRTRKEDGYDWDTKLFGILPLTRETTRAWYVDESGSVYVARYGMLYKFDPGKKKDYGKDYPAFIRKVSTASGSILYAGSTSKIPPDPRKQAGRRHVLRLASTPGAKLKYLNNSLMFDFSAAYYEQSHKNLYQIKLEGFDEDWSRWSDGTRKEYTNLPEGKYTFWVKARNIYGKESRKASYHFVILPPWYRTLWAYAGYLVVGILCMYAGMRLYFIRLLRTKKRLEEIVKYRTAELQANLDGIKQQKNIEIEQSMEHLKKTQTLLEAASQRAGMAELATSVLHNVGNVLTSVNISSNILKEKLRGNRVSRLQDLVRLLNEHQEDLSEFFSKDSKGQKIPLYLQLLEERLSSEQASMMDEVARLQSSIDHIKAIVGVQQSHAGAGGVLERFSLERLVDEALVMSGVMVNGSEIQIVKDIEYMDPVLIEPHTVLQILVNLMSNAKHSLRASKNESKMMTIQIKKTQPGQVCISVADNGVGISDEAKKKLFAYGFTTKGDGHGFGLHRSAASAKDMGGSLLFYSDGPDKGACFKLELPVNAKRMKVQPDNEALIS